MPKKTAGSAFAPLGLRPELLQSLATLGYEEATPIQLAAIPVLLEGRQNQPAVIMHMPLAPVG